MNILMLGWELPPKFSGGLGVACEGLLNGIASGGESRVTFVFPDFHGPKHEELKLLALAVGPSEQVPPGVLRSSAVPVGDPGSRSTEVLDVPGECPARDVQSGVHISPPHDAIEDLRSVSMQIALSSSSYSPGIESLAERYARAVVTWLPWLPSFDIIHAHDWLTYGAAIEVKRITGRTFVAHVHSTEFDRMGPKGAMPGIVGAERRGLAQADRIIAVSDYTRRSIVDTYGVDRNRIDVIHNAATAPNNPAMTHPSQRHGDTVAFIGRITDQKGPQRFVEAAYSVWSRRPTTRFVMAGSGDLELLMRSLVRSLGMSEAFTFPGFLDQDGVQGLLARSSALVMPSISEPFGIAALEAMHASVPVVITKRSGLAELMSNVIRVDPNDSEAVADELIALLDNPQLARNLAARAKQEANQLSWQDAARQLNEVLRRTCEATRASPSHSSQCEVITHVATVE